ADASRVRQAVENLVANAVQHAPPGTRVRIHVGQGQEQSDAKSSAVIMVSDQGSGIDPKLLPRLFDRFARSSESTGLGLGLFLARKIAEAHGGRIEVTSSPVTGTQFCLVLPMEPGRPG